MTELEMETVWTGDLWRSFGPPPIGTEPDENPSVTRQQVIAWLAADREKWWTATELATVQRVSKGEVQDRVLRLHAEGKLDRQYVTVKHRTTGRPWLTYAYRLKDPLPARGRRPEEADGEIGK